MRRAELLALRWSDVDLGAAVVTARRNYVRVNRKSLEKDSKTQRSGIAGGPPRRFLRRWRDDHR